MPFGRARYDFSYHKAFAQRGIYLEYDTINRPKHHDDRAEMALIMHMAKKGYADRLPLGLDTTNLRLKSYGVDVGLDYI